MLNTFATCSTERYGSCTMLCEEWCSSRSRPTLACCKIDPPDVSKLGCRLRSRQPSSSTTSIMLPTRLKCLPHTSRYSLIMLYDGAQVPENISGTQVDVQILIFWITETMQHGESLSDEYPCFNFAMTNNLNGIDSRIARP